MEGGKFVKDLAATGRELGRVVIVDDNPNAYAMQPENAVPVVPFRDDLGDEELKRVLKFLEMAVVFDDARDAVASFLAGSEFESRKLFDEMPHPDAFTYATMITAHTRRGDMASAGYLFDEMPVRSKAAWNAMIVGYAKAGEVDRAGDLFEQMPVKDLVSWTSMISCYSQSRRFRDAVGVFYKMIESDVLPDRVTMAAVIAVCAHLGALDIGIELHHYAMFAGFEHDVYIGSALVDMYAKCRSIERALVVFFKLREKNLFCWNAVIEGLAMHGRSEETVDMFGRMKREGIQPNWVSFLGACTHVGLAEEGRRMFASMTDEYSLVPRVEHYGCMVDLLGRGGFLQETLELIEKMPMEANAAVWGALLGACKIHENLKIGKIAGEKLMVLEPDNSGYYLLLVNMYGGAKRWGETAEMREVMNWRGVEKKSPGCSWIEMDGVVLEFAATDTAHTAADEVCFLLLGLDGQLKLAGYVQESKHRYGGEWRSVESLSNELFSTYMNFDTDDLDSRASGSRNNDGAYSSGNETESSSMNESGSSEPQRKEGNKRSAPPDIIPVGPRHSRSGSLDSVFTGKLNFGEESPRLPPSAGQGQHSRS